MFRDSVVRIKSFTYSVRIFNQVKPTRALRKQFLHNRIVELWDGLPVAIRMISYLCLVRKLMNFILIS